MATVRSTCGRDAIIRSSSSPQIEDREEHDPDYVDEMPVERAEREACIFGERVFALRRLKKQHGKEDHADKDVDAVHARKRIESGAENTARSPAGVNLDVLDDLPAQEQDAEHNGRDHPIRELHEVLVLPVLQC